MERKGRRSLSKTLYRLFVKMLRLTVVFSVWCKPLVLVIAQRIEACVQTHLNWSKILVPFMNRKSGWGRACVSSQVEKCIDLSSFKRRISCDASGCCFHRHIRRIHLSHKIPYWIWESKNSLLKRAKRDLILKSHTECCCAVVDPLVPQVTAALATFLPSSKLSSLLQQKTIDLKYFITAASNQVFLFRRRVAEQQQDCDWAGDQE